MFRFFSLNHHQGATFPTKVTYMLYCYVILRWRDGSLQCRIWDVFGCKCYCCWSSLCQPSCTWFHKKLSRNASSNGRTAGRSVCITKETTLKGIRVSDVKINNCVFADQRSDTFCTAHVWDVFGYKCYCCWSSFCLSVTQSHWKTQGWVTERHKEDQQQ